MKNKQEQVLAMAALLVALLIPIKVTAVIVVLVVLWFFRDPIWRAVLKLPQWAGALFSLFKRPKKNEKAQPKPTDPPEATS